MWFGTFGGGVSRYQEDIWTTFTTTDGLADNHVFAIFESSDGALWFGTPYGVSRYHEGIWKTFTKADELAGNYVTAIHESRDGALWFGTARDGVSRYHEDIWKTFTTADGLAFNSIMPSLSPAMGRYGSEYLEASAD